MINLVGCLRDFYVFVKFQPDLTIRGGIPCIILTNGDSRWLDSMSSKIREWFDVNVPTVMINEKFY